MLGRWVYSNLNSGGSAGSGSSAQYDLDDNAYLNGEVREVATHSQFEQAMVQHKDDTGLPVVVDFFSHSCGPCRMIEPSFRALAQEYAGRAVFLKVDGLDLIFFCPILTARDRSQCQLPDIICVWSECDAHLPVLLER